MVGSSAANSARAIPNADAVLHLAKGLQTFWPQRQSRKRQTSSLTPKRTNVNPQSFCKMSSPPEDDLANAPSEGEDDLFGDDSDPEKLLDDLEDDDRRDGDQDNDEPPPTISVASIEFYRHRTPKPTDGTVCHPFLRVSPVSDGPLITPPAQIT